MSQRNDHSASQASNERGSDPRKDRHRSTPNIDASSVNNPNQPLTLSERLNGLSSGHSVANFRRNTQNSSHIEKPAGVLNAQQQSRPNRHSNPQQYNPGQFLQLHQNNSAEQAEQQPRNAQSTRNSSQINRVLTDQELQIKKDGQIAQALQREEEEKFARSLLLHQNNTVIR